MRDMPPGERQNRRVRATARPDSIETCAGGALQAEVCLTANSAVTKRQQPRRRAGSVPRMPPLAHADVLLPFKSAARHAQKLEEGNV